MALEATLKIVMMALNAKLKIVMALNAKTENSDDNGSERRN